jgi:hypothetical protein
MGSVNNLLQIKVEDKTSENTTCWTCFRNTKRLEHNCHHIQETNPNHKYKNVISLADRRLSRKSISQGL